MTYLLCDRTHPSRFEYQDSNRLLICQENASRGSRSATFVVRLVAKAKAVAGRCGGIISSHPAPARSTSASPARSNQLIAGRRYSDYFEEQWELGETRPPLVPGASSTVRCLAGGRACPPAGRRRPVLTATRTSYKRLRTRSTSRARGSAPVVRRLVRPEPLRIRSDELKAEMDQSLNVKTASGGRSRTRPAKLPFAHPDTFLRDSVAQNQGAAVRHRRAFPQCLAEQTIGDDDAKNLVSDPPSRAPYSHSIVAGGFPETSYTTRLIPRTSLMMRFDTRASRSCGSGAHCAVMKSCVCTARNATAYS